MEADNGISNLDCNPNTQQYSTSVMMENAYKVCSALNAIVNRILDLEYDPYLGDCTRVSTGSEFLFTATEGTEVQSGSSYDTMNLSTMTFKFLNRKQIYAIDSNDFVFKEVPTKMLQKIEEYQSIICSETANLCRTSDP